MSKFFKFVVFLLKFTIIPNIFAISNANSSNIRDSPDYYFLDEVADTQHNPPQPQNYISQGYYAEDAELTRHVVSLRYATRHRILFGSNHFCAGTILDEYTIISAAHCFTESKGKFLKPEDVKVVVGTPDRTALSSSTRIHKVKKIKMHPKYDTKYSIFYDIATLILEEPIIENADTVLRAALPTAQIKPGTQCTVVGWGRLYLHGPLADAIFSVNLTIWGLSQCRKRYEAVDDGMLCASDPTDFEKDACIGDSGGPMFCDGFLTGLVSWGKGCASPGYPGVFTDVYHYGKFIGRRSYASTHKISLPCLLFIILYIFFSFDSYL